MLIHGRYLWHFKGPRGEDAFASTKAQLGSVSLSESVQQIGCHLQVSSSETEVYSGSRLPPESDGLPLQPMIEHMVEDVLPDNVIPLPNVSSNILSKVIEYCKKHVLVTKFVVRSATVGEELKASDADFVKVNRKTLFDLIMAANYLDIKGLVDLTCQTVADMAKDMTPDEIRNTFNIKNDFTEAEEERVRRENQWAFE